MCIFIYTPVTRQHEVARNEDFDTVAASINIQICSYIYICIYICIYVYILIHTSNAATRGSPQWRFRQCRCPYVHTYPHIYIYKCTARDIGDNVDQSCTTIAMPHALHEYALYQLFTVYCANSFGRFANAIVFSLSKRENSMCTTCNCSLLCCSKIVRFANVFVLYLSYCTLSPIVISLSNCTLSLWLYDMLAHDNCMSSVQYKSSLYMSSLQYNTVSFAKEPYERETIRLYDMLAHDNCMSSVQYKSSLYMSSLRVTWLIHWRETSCIIRFVPCILHEFICTICKCVCTTCNCTLSL